MHAPFDEVELISSDRQIIPNTSFMWSALACTSLSLDDDMKATIITPENACVFDKSSHFMLNIVHIPF
jgi:hypothetical protein